MSGIQNASNQSIKPFKSSEEYLYAMKEDLAEWLKELYGIDIDVNNILEILETGALLCAHANNVTRVAGEFLQKTRPPQIPLPTSGVTFVSAAQPHTFLARDNVSNFINWCRCEMHIKDVLMFETNDLVLRKNEKNFVLCLLEVARRASRFGMAAPVLIQLEEEIEEEIQEDMDLTAPEPTQLKFQRQLTNIQNLDEMVQYLISRCTCPTQFPMVKVSEGKYRVGDSSTLIFVRILRNHVMVRVGGGWDTLEHYLDKHDPCRCTSLTHKLAQRPATPVHEITARLTPRPDGQTGTAQPALLLSRTQPPQQPVLWTPTRAQRVTPTPQPSRSPDPGPRTARDRTCATPSPNRLWGRPSSPSQRLNCAESKDDSVLYASTRVGREATRGSPSPRLTSSLPRCPPTPATPQPERQRPSSPMVSMKTQSQAPIPPHSGPQSKLGQTWTKAQFVSKLRQSASAGLKSSETQTTQEKLEGPGSSRPIQCFTPVQCLSTSRNPSSTSSIQCLSTSRNPTSTIIQHTESNSSPQKSPDFIRTFCPSKGLLGVISADGHARPLTPINKGQQGGLTHSSTTELKPSQGSCDKGQAKSSIDGGRKQHLAPPVSKFCISQDTIRKRCHLGSGSSEPSNVPGVKEMPSPSVKVCSGEGEMERSCLFIPPPISAAQEAILYRSLEHEILSNLQQLNLDSDGGSCSEDDQHSQHAEPSKIPKVVTPQTHDRTRSTHLNQTHKSHPLSKVNSDSEVGFDSVIAELSTGKKQLNKVSIGDWVNTLPGASRFEGSEVHTQASSGHLKISKSCITSSWSSLGSSMGSKEPDESLKVSGETKTAQYATQALGVSETKRTPKSSSSFNHKRCLKKPERVPSIYKLKLKPRVRPRRDHRPDRTPSKIPTPVSCRRNKENEDEFQTKSSMENPNQFNAHRAASTDRRPHSSERSTGKQ